MTSEQSASDGALSLTSKPNLVFYGGAGAGKSTACEFLVQEYGYTCLSFATPLKEIAVRLWGEDAFADRDKLQKLGMALREIDEDVFVNYMLRELDHKVSAREPGEKAQFAVANDDCRFPNEYWKLKERGFIFVRVLAQEETRVDRLLRIGKLQDHSQLQHASETALLGIDATKEGIVDDYTIFNNGTTVELYNDIENVLTDVEGQV